jgi:prolipoprotein diacylglyceryltransferase
MSISVYQLWHSGKGLPISHLPPTSLVQSGIYKFWRHPIYVGYTVTLVGASILLNSTWTLIFCIPMFILGWIVYAVFHEEPALISRFPIDYPVYKAETAILVPNQIPGSKLINLERITERTFAWLNKMANWTVLFRKGEFIFVTYGLFIALGGFFFLVLLSSSLFSQNLTRSEILILVVISVASIYFFSKLFWWIENWHDLKTQQWFGLRHVGFVSWGAFAGLGASILFFSFLYDYPILMVSDAVVRSVFMAWVIGRLGCLTYGCCCGLPKESPGIIYRNIESTIVRETGRSQPPRHPTPVYSALHCAITLVCLNSIIVFFSLPVGFITATGMILYAVGRAFIEYFRERSLHVYGHLSCLTLFCGGWFLLFLLSPITSEFSPQPLNFSVVDDVLPIIPILASLSLIAFLATGLHRKEIGMV